MGKTISQKFQEVNPHSAQSAPKLRTVDKPQRGNREHLVWVIPATIVVIVAFVYVISVWFAGYQSIFSPQTLDTPFGSALISYDPPPLTFVLLAIGAGIVAGLSTLFFEKIAQPKISPSSETVRGNDSPNEGKGINFHVTIIIPAHNEESTLPHTLLALQNQTVPPDEVIVVADNCTDNTAEVVERFNHTLFTTVNNVDKKSGALNQALRRFLPFTKTTDIVLIMDADTELSPRFIEVGVNHLRHTPHIDAVGGIFHGTSGGGIVGQFQRNEYERYALQMKARRGRVFVLTGTASLFRAEVLREVANARGVTLPGVSGDVYDSSAITEDNELTLALKTLHKHMTSLHECYVITEIMPTWSTLWTQRKRWQRGALDNLTTYGFTKTTLRYWAQQIGLGYSVFALNLALILFLVTVLSVSQWIWFPFWLFVGFVFLMERVITVWAVGVRGRTLALLLIPEIIYDQFIQLAFVVSITDAAFGKENSWGHLSKEEQARVQVHNGNLTKV